MWGSNPHVVAHWSWKAKQQCRLSLQRSSLISTFCQAKTISPQALTWHSLSRVTDRGSTQDCERRNPLKPETATQLYIASTVGHGLLWEAGSLRLGIFVAGTQCSSYELKGMSTDIWDEKCMFWRMSYIRIFHSSSGSSFDWQGFDMKICLFVFSCGHENSPICWIVS